MSLPQPQSLPQTSLASGSAYPNGGYCCPPPDTSPRNWTTEQYQCTEFEELMRRQQLAFNYNRDKNQELLHASIADLKFGLVLSHGELSGKVDHLTATTSRFDRKLAEHSEILYALRDDFVHLRMDVLHLPSQESQSGQREAQTSQASTSSAPLSVTPTAAVPPPPPLDASTSTSQPVATSSGNSSVPANNHESSAASNSNAENIPANNTLPINNTSQAANASSTSAVAANGQESAPSVEVVIDCRVQMVGCCGGMVDVPVTYEKGDSRSHDLYICSFCNRPYKKSYYLHHVQTVCLPKLPCSLCGAPPTKSSKRLRKS